MFRRHVTTATVVGLIALAGCSNADPLGEDAPGAGTALVVGSQQYYSNEIIAEIYAQALEDAGYAVTREYQIGQREVYLPEIEKGGIDVFPEYTGNMLHYYDKESTVTAPEDIIAALPGVLPEGLRVLDAADANDQDSFNVTQEFAEEYSLTSIGDLANADVDLMIAANSEFASRPYGPDGIKEAYGVDVTLVPVEDSGGPLTVKALKDGRVQVADIYSADPSIQREGLVTLEDPKSLMVSNQVIPLVSDKVDATAAEVINRVQAKLSSEELISLNLASVDEQKKSSVLAEAWLKDQGLTS